METMPPGKKQKGGTEGPRVYTRTVLIRNELGLHARAASLVAALAARARGRVSMAYKGREADLGCVLSMIALHVGPGQSVTLRAEHPDDRAILDRVEALAARGFEEQAGEEKPASKDTSK